MPSPFMDMFHFNLHKDAVRKEVRKPRLRGKWLAQEHTAGKWQRS